MLRYYNARPQLTCSQCERKFRHYSNLQQHIRYAHEKKKEAEEETNKPETYNTDGEFKPQKWLNPPGGAGFSCPYGCFDCNHHA